MDAYVAVQGDVDRRIEYARAVRAAIAAGASVELSSPLGSGGVTSYVRHACVVRSGTAGANADRELACEYIAVLKCEHAPNPHDPREYAYDASIAALLSRLVEAKVSPHFTLLYHVNAAPQREQDAKCMLLETNEITLYDFLRSAEGNDDDVVFSAVFQVIHAILAAFVTFGISHNDLHRNNVMGVRVPRDTVYEYEYIGRTRRVPLCGWLWKIIDFNHADIGMSHDHAKLYWASPFAGPVNDIMNVIPTRLQMKKQIMHTLHEFSTISPAVHVDILCTLLNTLAREFEESAYLEQAPTCTFSLRNDAAMTAVGDGSSIEFASVKSYYLINAQTLLPSRLRKSFEELKSKAPESTPVLLHDDYEDDEPPADEPMVSAMVSDTSTTPHSSISSLPLGAASPLSVEELPSSAHYSQPPMFPPFSSGGSKALRRAPTHKSRARHILWRE